MLISLVSKLVMKKLASVGPSGYPIVTLLICWYSSSLYKNNSRVALNISFTKMSLLNDGQLGLPLAYTKLAIDSIVSAKGTFVNREITSKLTVTWSF